MCLQDITHERSTFLKSKISIISPQKTHKDRFIHTRYDHWNERILQLIKQHISYSQRMSLQVYYSQVSKYCFYKTLVGKRRFSLICKLVAVCFLSEEPLTVILSDCKLWNLGRWLRHKFLRNGALPFVWGPVFAIDSTPFPLCKSLKFSSSNFFPYIDFPHSPPWCSTITKSESIYKIPTILCAAATSPTSMEVLNQWTLQSIIEI